MTTYAMVTCIQVLFQGRATIRNFIYRVLEHAVSVTEKHSDSNCVFQKDGLMVLNLQDVHRSDSLESNILICLCWKTRQELLKHFEKIKYLWSAVYLLNLYEMTVIDFLSRLLISDKLKEMCDKF